MESKNEIAKKVNDKMEELQQMSELESLIKDNMIEFPHEGDIYRIAKPTQRVKEEAHQKKSVKYLELLNDDQYLFRDQLIAKYKEKGIDLNKMDNELVTIQKQHDDLLLRLAEMKNPEDIVKIKREIMNLRQAQSDIIMKRADLLQYSIEQKVIDFLNSYFLYSLLEIKRDVSWERKFKSYDDFLDSNDSELLMKAMYYMSLTVNNRVNEL